MGAEQPTSGSTAGGMSSGGGGISPVQSAAVTGSAQYAGQTLTQAQTSAGVKKVKKAIEQSGTQMYGGVASQATNEYLVSIGEAVPTGGGGYMLTPRGHEIKYGSYTPGGPQTPTGMGTVGAGGIMNEIPISEKMFESQKKLQMIATGAMALTGIPLMGAAYLDIKKKKYDDYVSSFNNIVKSPTVSSYGITSNQSTQASSLDSGNAQYAGQTQEIAAEAERQKKLALSRKAIEAASKRTFFGGKTRVIEGKMVGGL